jgi:bacterioferritin (cytochrome b1)
MPTPSAAIIDALNSLLEAEIQSIFHFVGKNSPLLENAGAEVRQSLDEMVHHLDQHAEEVAQLIRHLGGKPSSPPAPKAEDQYLSYLSLRFLLPKLVDAKELMIQRYRNALQVVEANAEVLEVLKRHIAEMEVDLKVLRKTAAEVSSHR